jgi:hypothetical protein
MDVAAASNDPFDRGDAGRFTGDVWLRSTLRAEDGTDVGVVHFAPRARTHWHRHPGGQFLFAVSGRGRVRSRGGEGHEWHFHGGTPDSPLVHVAVNGGGSPEWSEPVTDEEYEEGF